MSKEGDVFMAKNKKEQATLEGVPAMELHYASFGERLREIRKARNLTQTQLADILVTSKQILSRYELGQRSPKIEQVSKYAEKLNVSVDYLLGDNDAEAISNELCSGYEGKPFYEIFIEVTYDKLGLDIPNLARVTGLTDRQIRTIITRRMKDAPLPIAMQLSETLDIPLEVWAGGKAFEPKELSADAYEVARAYNKAESRDKNIARMALNLELIKETK